jgi:integrase/recombinase XerD
MWEAYKKGFKAYLGLERSLSDHSVQAYLSDIDKLTLFLQAAGLQKTPAELQLPELQQFVRWVAELGMTQTSQARIISGDPCVL